MIPRPEMILKFDRKWSLTANDPLCRPQIIPPETRNGMQCVPWVEVSIFSTERKLLCRTVRESDTNNKIAYGVMICGFSVSSIFPQVIKVIVRSLNILCKLTNQPSCPDSVHVTHINIELLAANCRCENPNWVAVLRCRLPSWLGHQYVTVTLGINTCFCICFSRLWRSIMTICNQIIWHNNGIQITQTQVVLVALSYHCCRSNLLRNGNIVYELWFLPLIFQKKCQEKN